MRHDEEDDPDLDMYGIRRTAEQLLNLPSTVISGHPSSQQIGSTHTNVRQQGSQVLPPNVNVTLTSQDQDDQSEPMNISSGSLWSSGVDDGKGGRGNF